MQIHILCREKIPYREGAILNRRTFGRNDHLARYCDDHLRPMTRIADGYNNDSSQKLKWTCDSCGHQWKTTASRKRNEARQTPRGSEAVESHFSKCAAGGGPASVKEKFYKIFAKGMLQFRSSSPLPTCAYSLYFPGPFCL
jgi:hypothetical protein